MNNDTPTLYADFLRAQRLFYDAIVAHCEGKEAYLKITSPPISYKEYMKLQELQSDAHDAMRKAKELWINAEGGPTMTLADLAVLCRKAQTTMPKLPNYSWHKEATTK